MADESRHQPTSTCMFRHVYVCLPTYVENMHTLTYITLPTYPSKETRKRKEKKSTVISKLELKLVWSLAQRTWFQTECEMHLGGLHDSHEVMSSTSVGPST